MKSFEAGEQKLGFFVCIQNSLPLQADSLCKNLYTQSSCFKGMMFTLLTQISLPTLILHPKSYQICICLSRKMYPNIFFLKCYDYVTTMYLRDQEASLDKWWSNFKPQKKSHFFLYVFSFPTNWVFTNVLGFCFQENSSLRVP